MIICQTWPVYFCGWKTRVKLLVERTKDTERGTKDSQCSSSMEICACVCESKSVWEHSHGWWSFLSKLAKDSVLWARPPLMVTSRVSPTLQLAHKSAIHAYSLSIECIQNDFSTLWLGTGMLEVPISQGCCQTHAEVCTFEVNTLY